MFSKERSFTGFSTLGSAVAVASIAAASSLSMLSAPAEAGSLTQALKTGKASGSILLRREVNDQSNGDVLNVRSRIGYTTGKFNGFTATVEFEDSRFMFGEDDNAGILEQEYTEVEQALVQFKDSKYDVTAKLGRQVIAMDGQRHIGHVGWRLDRQTFDAGRVIWKPTDKLNIDLAYLYKVNRINSSSTDGEGFGDVDVDSKLLNVSYQTPVGKLTGYSYNLSDDGPYPETETYGLSLAGSSELSDGVKGLYSVEYATQKNLTTDLETDYQWIELGLSASGYTGKLGYEVLGSDSAGGTTGSFTTPYATVHKFAGWADVFAGQSLFGTAFGGVGLVDKYVSFATKKFGPKFVVAYHEFEPDGSASFDTFGDELDILLVKPLTKVFTVAAKAAKFNGRSESGLTDKQVLWFWAEAKF